MSHAPLSGVRVVESSMLGPAELGGLLADLGAEVIKVEPPQGDYGRQMTWPIVKSMTGEGENSLLSLHVNRGKRSIAIDLRKPEGVEIYLDLVKDADVVIEAMRPGSLAKRGLSFEKLQEVNPKIVFCSISGYGATGPYKDMPSHGIVYDTWAGQVPIEVEENGYTVMPEHSQHRHPRRAYVRRPGRPGRGHRGPGHRDGLVAGCRPVRLGRLLRLVPHRDLEGLLPPRGRGVRQQDRQLRAPGPRHRRHAGGRPLPDLRHLRRPRPVHGQRAGVLEELRRRASAGPTSSRSGPAASTAITPATTKSCRAS